MTQTVTIAPINSMLFLMDPARGAVPEFEPEKLVLSTPSCISFRCFMEQDGPTEIVIGPADEVSSKNPPNFDGFLETPHRTDVLSSIETPQVLTTAVKGRRTRVRIWANHPSQPDHVVVGLG